MRVVELDGRSWSSIDDVFDTLLPALGAPDRHGRNMGALIDSIGTGAINAVEPPYTLKFEGASEWPADVRDFLKDLQISIAERTAEHRGANSEWRQIEFVFVDEK